MENNVFFFQNVLLTFYGPNCNASCSEYCQYRICHRLTGYCIACIEARTGNLCEHVLQKQGKILEYKIHRQKKK